MLASGGVVTLEVPTHGLEWVAGFDSLKAWEQSRSRAFEPDAMAFGLAPPRGLLLTGVPGCGKCFMAKAIAHTWKMPLLRLDAGSLYDSFVGAFERNLREALATAGALAPSVLWIDEIEKGFGTTGPSQTDGGLGYLTRQGRFDETFFVDLPEPLAREHLYRLQLARMRRHHEQFDCAALAEATEGFSGAEIEQSVTNALYAAFAEQREVTTQDIAREVASTRPLSQVSGDVVQRIRDWGAAHARPA